MCYNLQGEKTNNKVLIVLNRIQTTVAGPCVKWGAVGDQRHSSAAVNDDPDTRVRYLLIYFLYILAFPISASLHKRQYRSNTHCSQPRKCKLSPKHWCVGCSAYNCHHKIRRELLGTAPSLRLWVSYGGTR